MPAVNFVRTFLLFFALFASAINWTSTAQEVKEIEIVNADDLIFDEESGIKGKRLLGNVVLKHESSVMYCDSAHVYNEINTMKAYSNVRIEDGDSVDLRGDYLEYDGNTRIAFFQGNVQLKHARMTLFTPTLTYNRSLDVAQYSNGGVLYSDNKEDTLYSKKGYYRSGIKLAQFRDSVRLNSVEYRIACDTMHYNTEAERSEFFGPTRIISGDDFIYCEDGWSDSKSGQSEFRKNARLTSGDQRLEGDTIFYDSKEESGRAFGHVSLVDTAENLIVKGQYGEHYRKDSVSFVTKDPLLIQVEDEDSLFLTADTLYSMYDTANERLLLAYPAVSFYRSDMQGKCDSIAFVDSDSSIKMFTDPILWSEENQISADYIQLNRSGGKLRTMDMNDQAFIASQSDSVSYDQIKGENMVGFFEENELRRVDVLANGETVYYAKENDTTDIGINHAVCTDRIKIMLDSSKVETITFYGKPNSTLYPIGQAPAGVTKLTGFMWRIAERPNKTAVIRRSKFDAEGD